MIAAKTDIYTLWDTYITHWHMNITFIITIKSVFPYIIILLTAHWNWQWLSAAFGASFIFSVQVLSHVRRKLQLPKHPRICHLSCITMTDSTVIEQGSWALCCSPGEAVLISLSMFDKNDGFCDSPTAVNNNTFFYKGFSSVCCNRKENQHNTTNITVYS